MMYGSNASRCFNVVCGLCGSNSSWLPVGILCFSRVQRFMSVVPRSGLCCLSRVTLDSAILQGPSFQ